MQGARPRPGVQAGLCAEKAHAEAKFLQKLRVGSSQEGLASQGVSILSSQEAMGLGNELCFHSGLEGKRGS